MKRDDNLLHQNFAKVKSVLGILIHLANLPLFTSQLPVLEYTHFISKFALLAF